MTERITEQDALTALRALLPGDVIVTDPDITAGYRQDSACDPGAGVPLAVVRPTCTEDVQSVMRWASAYGVPVVPRGAGSGLSGGASAVDGGIVLSLERMRAISVNPVARVAVAQPGAFNAEVKKAAAAQGLWYPPDPSSFELSSIGGNVATNAGGLCCVKYGVTTDYVLGMQVVLADGTALRLGGPRLKDAAGLSLAKLFVGSEGVLGVITELTMRLLPAASPSWTLVAVFESIEDAAGAVLAITSKVRPAMLELMDNISINVVEDLLHMDLDRAAGALLIARSDAPGAAAADEIALMTEACNSSGAAEAFSTDDEAEGEAFAAARRAFGLAMGRLGDLLLEDVGVPLPELPALVRGLGRIAAANGVQIATVAHAGDGNTHPTIAYTASDPDSTARARKAFSEIIGLALSLGGTITGEHGTGRLKAPWLPDQLGPDVMALTQRIKHALDPAGILNPGTLLSQDPPSARAVADQGDS
jgi:glycolate oxidase